MLLKKTVWLVFVIIFISAGLIFIITELKKSKGQRIDRIILITIDTLRADHLGCYGYPRQTTPFIDTLAREGYSIPKCIRPRGYDSTISCIDLYLIISTSAWCIV